MIDNIVNAAWMQCPEEQLRRKYSRRCPSLKWEQGGEEVNWMDQMRSWGKGKVMDCRQSVFLRQQRISKIVGNDVPFLIH